MTQPTVTMPDCVTMIELAGTRRLAALAQVTADLMTEAVQADLPAPGSINLSGYDREITLCGFGCDRAACQALAQWAERYGATLTGEPGADSDGRAHVRCDVTFTWHSARIRAYAYIDAEPAVT
jgi:hypothetical protein